MFTGNEFRAKAAECGEKANNTSVPGEISEFLRSKQGFSDLARNEDWLADNFDKLIRSRDVGAQAVSAPPESSAADEVEEHILRCLGAAVIMQWNTMPTKLQRELFDTAGSLGDVLKTTALRGQIARFLHEHKDEENAGGGITPRK
jgi:hypothetical protein